MSEKDHISFLLESLSNFSLCCLFTQFWLFSGISELIHIFCFRSILVESFLSWKLACYYCRFSTSWISRLLKSGGFRKPCFCGPPHSTIVLGSIVLFIRKKRDFSKGLWHTSPWKTSFYCLSFNKQAFLNFFVSAVCLWCNRIRNKTGTSKVGAISKAQKAQKRIFFFQKMSHSAKKCKRVDPLGFINIYSVAKSKRFWTFLSAQFVFGVTETAKNHASNIRKGPHFILTEKPSKFFIVLSFYPVLTVFWSQWTDTYFLFQKHSRGIVCRGSLLATIADSLRVRCPVSWCQVASKNLFSVDLRIQPSCWAVLFFLSEKKRDFSKGLWHTSPWKTSFYCLSFNKQAFLNFFVSTVCLWCNRIRNKTGTSKVGAISKAQKAQKRIFSFRKCRLVPKNVKGGPFGLY